MPRLTVSSDNRSKTSDQFPKLKLEQGERAKIVIWEDPLVEYVHTLRKPVIAGGRAVMVDYETRSGDTKKVNKMDFVGRPICLGDFETIQDRGSDPKNCPICKAADEEENTARPPERRFAMHVLRYSLQQNSFRLAVPFVMQSVVWAFGDSLFDRLCDWNDKWGNLQDHDLDLGPCTVPQFQKFDIEISPEAEWKKDQKRIDFANETFAANQAADLSVFCGRKTEARWLKDDLEKIRSAWRIASGEVPAETATAHKEALSAGIADLLDSPASSESSEFDSSSFENLLDL